MIRTTRKYNYRINFWDWKSFWVSTFLIAIPNCPYLFDIQLLEGFLYAALGSNRFRYIEIRRIYVRFKTTDVARKRWLSFIGTHLIVRQLSLPMCSNGATELWLYRDWSTNHILEVKTVIQNFTLRKILEIPSNTKTHHLFLDV